MPGFACNFCAHRNPDGSKFCNECGSPLHLAPCVQCEAINNVSDERCTRCGAPLSRDVAEQAPAVPEQAPAVAEQAPAVAEQAPAVAATFSSDTDDSESPAVAGGSVPIALADRMDDFPWAARPARSPVRAAERDEPTASPMVVADVTDSSDAAASAPHATGRTYYDARKPRRARSVVLAMLLVAIAAAVYWSSLSRLQPTEPGTVTVEAPEPSTANPTAAVATPEAKTEASEVTQEQVPTTAVQDTPEPASAQSTASPASAATDSTSAASPSAQSDREATPQSAEPAKAADTSPAVAESSRKSSARRADDARRRSPPYMRTREQAERDALATQRLIARDLGTAPPAKAAPAAGSPR